MMFDLVNHIVIYEATEHILYSSYPSSNRDIELLRSLCIGSLVLRNCRLRAPLM